MTPGVRRYDVRDLAQLAVIARDAFGHRALAQISRPVISRFA
jgi:hypothetical protein